MKHTTMRIKIASKWGTLNPDHQVEVEFQDGTILDRVSVTANNELDVKIPYLTEVVDIRPTKVAIRLRIKPPKRRSPTERLKSRLYYRRNRAKLRVQRKRYLRKNKTTIKNRKLFKRYKPSWMKKPTKPTHVNVKKFKPTVPKRVKTTH